MAVRAKIFGVNVNHDQQDDRAMDLRQAFAENLALYLKKSKKTQRQLAAELGVTEGAVSNWIRGKDFPNPKRIEKIAAYFHITTSKLIDPSDAGIKALKPDIETVRELVNVLNKLLKNTGFKVIRDKK